jgi:hypothetical protein
LDIAGQCRHPMQLERLQVTALTPGSLSAASLLIDLTRA